MILQGRENATVLTNSNIEVTASICFLCKCLGISVQEQYIKKVVEDNFPTSPLELIIVYLFAEMGRAYAGNPRMLTEETVISIVCHLILWNNFQTERELKQCIAYCVPKIDNFSSSAALIALESSRILNNQYRNAIMIVLTIEVLARLVKHYADLRFELDYLTQVVFNNNCTSTLELIEQLIKRLQYQDKMIQDITLSHEAAFRRQLTGENHA